MRALIHIRIYVFTYIPIYTYTHTQIICYYLPMLEDSVLVCSPYTYEQN